MPTIFNFVKCARSCWSPWLGYGFLALATVIVSSTLIRNSEEGKTRGEAAGAESEGFKMGRREERSTPIGGHVEGVSKPRLLSRQSTKEVPLVPEFAALDADDLSAMERVRKMQSLRGLPLAEGERMRALEFLSGNNVPGEIDKAAAQWLADELLTALRQQQPRWDGLAAALSEVAFQPGTDPVIRDYVMQHLGHLWEQDGAREEIDSALWRAIETSDETTPGTALIALSRGYERDQQAKSLVKVRQRAFELAKSPETPLASRVTALAIAGSSGGTNVRQLADELAKSSETPVILKKVAQHVASR